MSPKLAGIMEIAEMLGVSRQRADQLSRTRGFPDPLTKCLPLDDRTEGRVREIYPGRIPAGRTADDVLDLMMANAYDLPEMPRLWRAIAVEEWANENGRELFEKKKPGRRS
jgi:hypothetical protein